MAALATLMADHLDTTLTLHLRQSNEQHICLLSCRYGNSFYEPFDLGVFCIRRTLHEHVNSHLGLINAFSKQSTRWIFNIHNLIQKIALLKLNIQGDFNLKDFFFLVFLFCFHFIIIKFRYRIILYWFLNGDM